MKKENYEKYINQELKCGNVNEDEKRKNDVDENFKKEQAKVSEIRSLELLT